MRGRAFEEWVASVFLATGRCKVESPARVHGARATHDIDVWVEFKTLLDAPDRWAVECKDLAGPVKKQHVLTFLAVVQDVGAHRGVMVSSRGYQRGAEDAATNTNLVLMTPADLPREVGNEVNLIDAIRALPERERIVVLLIYFEGLTLERVAQVLGEDVLTIGRVKKRALERLPIALWPME